MLADIIHTLPLPGDGRCWCFATDHGTKSIVEPHLIVEIVKASTANVIAVKRRIINLGNEDDGGICLAYAAYGPFPEFHWHHLCHIATEGVHTLRAPEEQDVEHLRPGGGYRVEVHTASTGIAIVHPVVELNRLIPVVCRRPGVEVVVAGGLRRLFDVRVFRSIAPEGKVGMQRFSPAIIEIVGGREMHARIVACAQVFHSLGGSVRMVLTAHVVGHKVDNQLQSYLVRTLHELLKFRHALFHINGKVGINVVVVLYGIGATGTAFYNCRVVALDAILRIVGLSGMLYHSREPYMRVAVRLYATQYSLRKSIELCTAVLCKSAI